MRKMFLDVLAIRPEEAGRLDDRVEDPHVESLSDEKLRELDVWTFAKVVGFRLEAQSEQGDGSLARVKDASCRQPKVRLVAAHHPVEHRQVDVGDASDVHEGAQVLRETGPAKGEAGAKVGGRDVELTVLAEDAHHVPCVHVHSRKQAP